MDELEQVDRYCDAVPRPLAVVEEHGPLRLFVPSGGHAWYARPSGAGQVGPAHLRVVLERQRALGLPLAVEWVGGRPDGLDVLCEAAGLRVHRYPLLVGRPDELRSAGPVMADVRMLGPDDDVGAAAAVADLGFANPGTAVGGAGLEAVDAARPEPEQVRLQRQRLTAGRPAVAAAFVDGRLVSRGGHTREGVLSEVTGVATLPAFRRRGLGAAVTAVLAGDAVRRGARLVWLSADSADVARVYERLGFRHLGWSGVAEA